MIGHPLIGFGALTVELPPEPPPGGAGGSWVSLVGFRRPVRRIVLDGQFVTPGRPG